MSVTRMRECECDNCHHVVMRRLDEPLEGWVYLDDIDIDGAEADHAWTRRLLCFGCWKAVTDALASLDCCPGWLAHQNDEFFTEADDAPIDLG